MNCQDVLEDIELCALGTLEPSETERVHMHAATCQRCRASLLAAEETVARLALSVPSVRAPESMRAAVLEGVHRPAAPEQQHSHSRSGGGRRLTLLGRRLPGRIGVLAASVLIAPLLGTLVWAAVLQRQVNNLRQDTAEMQRRSDGLMLFAVPSSIKGDFRPAADNVSATGAVTWNPDRGVCFVIFDRLPAAEPGATYRLWYMVDGTRLVDAGEVTPDANGRADMAIDASRWRGRVYDMVLRLERRPHERDAQPLLSAQLQRPD